MDLLSIHICIYMVRSKARQHFQVSNVKKSFFAEAGTKKVCCCVSKQKMFYSDQGTYYLEHSSFRFQAKTFMTNFGTDRQTDIHGQMFSCSPTKNSLLFHTNLYFLLCQKRNLVCFQDSSVKVKEDFSLQSSEILPKNMLHCRHRSHISLVCPHSSRVFLCHSTEHLLLGRQRCQLEPSGNQHDNHHLLKHVIINI